MRKHDPNTLKYNGQHGWRDRNSRVLLLSLFLVSGIVTVFENTVQAQPAAAPPGAAGAPAPAANPEQTLLSINFPENIELKVFVEFVSQRLGTNILYDEQIGSKRITLRAPTKVPKESLMGLLESVLKMKGMAIVDADQPGWKRIVNVTDMAQVGIASREKKDTSG